MTAADVLVRVVIVDDHRLVRSGVRGELEGHVEVVGEAEDVASAIEVILRTEPDVVLLDVHLPGGGGAAVVTGVHATLGGVCFLALSVSDAAEDVISVVRAGARGYVTKAIAPEELIEAIHRVHGGDAVFSPRLAGYVLDAFAGAGVAPDGSPSAAPDAATSSDGLVGAPADADLDRLTARERDVLRLIARGYAYKQVARRLDISIKTVESHMGAVLRKLQLSSRYELARWAAERDLD
jgi:DNA-binding NarL/FixJ family response regulator